MKASETQVKRFLELRRDEKAITQLLSDFTDLLARRMSDNQRLYERLWQEVCDQHGLDENKRWSINHKTGEISERH